MEQLFIHVNTTDLQELTSLVESKIISTRVADTYPLTEATTAYKHLANGGLRGRLVLTP